MSPKKTITDDKPQEEFRDDSPPNKSKGKSEEHEEKNYDEWTLEQLQIEAHRQGIAEGMMMDKEQLIRKLRG